MSVGLIASWASCAFAALDLYTLGLSGIYDFPWRFEISFRNSSIACELNWTPSVLIYVISPVVSEPIFIPSYNFWAILIVLDAPKPSLFEASCWRVEVVNGAKGFLLTLFLSIFSIWKDDLLIWSRARLASFSFLISIFASFWLLIKTSLAVKSSLLSFAKTEEIDQYSSILNFSISISLSHISFKATDCTLPADLEPGSFLHNIGDIENPIRWSKALLAKYASTNSVFISLGIFIASKTAFLVISLKTTRWTGLSCIVFLLFRISFRCQLIASPSLSGSVARIRVSAVFNSLIISFTTFSLSLCISQDILKLSSGRTAPSLDGKSLTWPTDAITL